MTESIDTTIGTGQSWSAIVPEGHYLTIVDIEGQQSVNWWASCRFYDGIMNAVAATIAKAQKQSRRHPKKESNNWFVPVLRAWGTDT